MANDTTKKRQHHAPDYKPFILRLPFLATLFLILCALTGVLEYLLRVLPHTHAQDARAIPHDSLYIPFRNRKRDQQQQQQRQVHGLHSADTDHGISRIPAQRPQQQQQRQQSHDDMDDLAAGTKPTTHMTSGSTTNTNTRPLITTSPPNSARREEYRRRINVLVSTLYPSSGIATTHVTMISQWYVPGNPNLVSYVYLPTPIFPGDDNNDDENESGKCVFNFQGLVISPDDTGCLAVIGLDSSGPLPEGLRWLFPSGEYLGVAVPQDSLCDGLGSDNGAWFFEMNLSNSANPNFNSINKELTIDKELFSAIKDKASSAFYTCTWQDSHRRKQPQETLLQQETSRSLPQKSDRVQIIRNFAAFRQRLADGRIMSFTWFMGGEPAMNVTLPFDKSSDTSYTCCLLT